VKLFYFLVLGIFLSTTLFGQKKTYVEGIGSFYFNSERHANDNGDQDVYGEIRIGYSANNYVSANVFAGFQRRGFIYYARFESPFRLVPLFMNRRYIPFGANLRIDITDVFYQKLKLWKKQGRWNIYNQIGFAFLAGKDKNDSRDNSFKNQGAYVPYYLVPYVVEYNNFYITYLAGLRYNLNKGLGIFIEGGDGALMNLQFGVSAKF
jgi:hypothetical protein